MELPEEIWLEICKFLQARDLCKLALVNKEFYSIASNNYPWKNIVLQKHQIIPKGVNNLKRNYAEINCIATRMISKFQSDTLQFERVLDKERQRQRKVLEGKRIERLIQKSLRQLEDL